MKISKRYLATFVVIITILVILVAISTPCVIWDKCGACGDKSIAITLLSVSFILLIIVALFLIAIQQILRAYRILSTTTVDV